MGETILTTEGLVPDGDASPQSLQRTLAAQVAAAQARPGGDIEHLPKRLSPSRASDFAQCPKVFYFKTICHIREPASMATTRGTLAHAAFERIFDHPAGTRTPEIAVSYIAPAWAEMTRLDLDEEQYPLGSPERSRELASRQGYRDLAPAGSDAEKELLQTASDVVRAWFTMERVNNFSPLDLELPDGQVIDGRELHVAADMFEVNLHGFIDRLDRWVAPNGDVIWSVSDYKTGKWAGQGKNYAPQTMERIRYESFFQLRVYALLCKEMLGIDVKYLRLIYVKSGDRDNGIKQMVVTPEILAKTKEEVRTIWKSILRSARTGRWDTRTGPLCDWCYFNDICPAIHPEMEGLPLEATAS